LRFLFLFIFNRFKSRESDSFPPQCWERTSLAGRVCAVEVEDHIWQRQLFALTPHILNNLEETLGRGLVEDLEFRIVPRRREPVMARQAVPALPVDDADAIADPVMRGIYKLSRKKAQA
jgi:hypothetical protein